jgi:D-inositol-3-phosphate glycosyltransferase
MINDMEYPKRICMLSVHTCPLATMGGKKTGGMNVYVQDISRELARRGIAVDVFTRSEDDCQPTIRHDLGYGARVIHVKAGPEQPIPLIEIADYLDDFVAGVLDFAAEEDVTYDLIHSHYWMSGLVAEELTNSWGNIPIIQMFHTLGHMKNRVALAPAERVPPERLLGESHVMTIANKIIAATPAEYAQLHWLYGADMNKVVTIPPGVALDRFSPIPRAIAKEQVGLEDRHKNILFAGRIEPLKGIETLLRAIALIQGLAPEIIEDVSVTIIGGDSWGERPDQEMARLQEIRTELGVIDIVTFMAAKAQEELPEYYAAAEMVVMPSHYESFGMVALEAMAMGTPVVASEVGGLAFLIQDGVNGFLVPSRDPEALAERIFTLLNDENCQRQLGQQAALIAKKYDWALIVERMLNVYQDVLQEA